MNLSATGPEPFRPTAIPDWLIGRAEPSDAERAANCPDPSILCRSNHVTLDVSKVIPEKPT